MLKFIGKVGAVVVAALIVLQYAAYEAENEVARFTEQQVALALRSGVMFDHAADRIRAFTPAERARFQQDIRVIEDFLAGH